MELGFSPPVFLPCRLISTANCKNAATPLSPTLHKMEKKGRKKRWIGAESGRYSVNYSRPIFRPFDAARRIDTQRSSMRPNLASWRINWQTRRARSVLSLPLSWSRGGGEFWTSYRGLVYFVGNVRSLFLVPLLIVRRRIVLRVSKLVQRILGTGRIREDSLWRYNCFVRNFVLIFRWFGILFIFF